MEGSPVTGFTDEDLVVCHASLCDYSIMLLKFGSGEQYKIDILTHCKGIPSLGYVD